MSRLSQQNLHISLNANAVLRMSPGHLASVLKKINFLFTEMCEITGEAVGFCWEVILGVAINHVKLKMTFRKLNLNTCMYLELRKL